MQDDGNFCVYRGSGPSDNHGALWCTGTDGAPGDQFFAYMQDDGNFCVYEGSGPSDNHGVLWCSGTDGAPGDQFFAYMQDDGNFCVYKGSDPSEHQGAIWCSGTSNPEPNFSGWMSQYFRELGDRKLSEIVLPGSHNAGMYEIKEISKCLGEGYPCNTKNQDRRIADQLSSGIRYFDVRPVYYDTFTECMRECRMQHKVCRSSCGNSIDPTDTLCEAGCDAEKRECEDNCRNNTNSVSQFNTGHFSDSSIGINGCMGGSLDDVLEDVAEFAEKQPDELVILKLSHYLNWNKSKFEFSSGIKKELTNKVTAALGPHLVKSQKRVNLLNLTLKEILEMGSVIALFDDIKTDWPSGILSLEELPIHDKFSDTNNSKKMMQDQFKKLKEHDDDNKLFLLSWTLTQDNNQAFACFSNPLGSNSKSIEDLAKEANDNLEQVLDKKNTDGKLFNILYTDYCDTVPTKICLKANGLL